jgi:hypothetical protein
MQGFGTYSNNIARIQTLENAELKIAYYTEINGTSGTITKPTGSTILLNQIAGGADALVCKLNSGPTGEAVTDSSLTIVDIATFNSSGDFTLTGTPSDYPIALIYWIKIPLSSYGNLDTDFIIEENMLYGLDAETGHYDPVFTIESNLDSISGTDFHYFRLGNEVYVRGAVDIDPTATASTAFSMTMPFASNFSAATQAHGFAIGNATSTGTKLIGAAETTLDEIRFSGSLNHSVSVKYDISFVYDIL